MLFSSEKKRDDRGREAADAQGRSPGLYDEQLQRVQQEKRLKATGRPKETT